MSCALFFLFIRPVNLNFHFLHFSIITQTIDGLWCKYQKNKEIFYCFYLYGVWLLNFFISKCPNHVPIILVYGGKNGASVQTKMCLLMFLMQISRDFIRAETKCIHTYEVLAFYFLPDHLHFLIFFWKLLHKHGSFTIRVPHTELKSLTILLITHLKLTFYKEQVHIIFACFWCGFRKY